MQRPPSWSPTSVLIAGLVVAFVATFVLGALFTWPFAAMAGFGIAAMALAVAWGAAHPPDPFD